MPDNTAIKDQLREVLVRSLKLDIEPSAVPDRELVGTLGLNSINTIEYLIWVETEFGIEIADEDLSVDLIDDLDRLAAYVVEAGGQVSSRSSV
jgi:acyl carrier protein